MRLSVHGNAYVISPGEYTDAKKTAVVVRVVVQEWVKKPDDTFEKSGEALFIDIHTAAKRAMDCMIRMNIGDSIMIDGRLKSGRDRYGHAVAYIEATDVAIMATKGNKPPRTPPVPFSMEPKPDLGVGGFTQADVGALPAMGERQ